jgi:hypothetical protein
VKLDKHQLQPIGAVGTADPSPPAAEQQSLFDPTTLVLLALFGAIVVTACWRVLLKIAIVGALALAFAGILVPVMWMTSRR